MLAAVDLETELLAAYQDMRLARAVDERLWILNRQGRVPFVISGQGHEAIQVAVARQLRAGLDWALPYYRDLPFCLTFGMSVEEIFLNSLSKAADPNSGGRQMPAHWGHRRLQIISQSSPVATQIPHAAGVAYAAKLRREGAVVYVSIGEGSTSEGDFHEGLNFAAVHRLPLLVVVENNGLAISVPVDQEMAAPVADRARAYGINAVTIDGTDYPACQEAAAEAVRSIRDGGLPVVIEARVARLTSHSSDDDQRRYRSAADLADAQRHDPVARLRDLLSDRGLWDEGHEVALKQSLDESIMTALAAAEASPDPDPATIERYVRAEG